MKGETVLHLCIADVNDLLTAALREHVLQVDCEVKEVFWDSRESVFHIKLVPAKSEASS